MDNRRKALIVAAVAAFATGAHAAPKTQYYCVGAGKCYCGESISPKGVLGYESYVTVTCTNMRTMENKYFDRIELSKIAGTYAGFEPAH